MKVKLIGIQNVDFTNKDTGEHIKGSKLHVVAVVEEHGPFCVGYRVAAIFTRLDVSKLKLGTVIDLVYEQQLGSNRSSLVSVLPAS